MPSFIPRYGQDGMYENRYIDLRNIPREQVTVTVSVKDERITEALEAKLKQLRDSKTQAVDAEQWAVVYRVSVKISVLEEILRKAGF
jgi:hypothetical protein